MSRSGYVEDYDEYFPNALALYRNTVDRAIAGKRGQEFLLELVAALDSMPDKRLIAEALEEEGAVCALGSVGLRRSMDMSDIEASDSHEVAKRFGIAECLAKEIVFENDEGGPYWRETETPEARWQRIRHWAVSNLRAA